MITSEFLRSRAFKGAPSTDRGAPVWPLAARRELSPVAFVFGDDDPATHLAYETRLEPGGPMVRRVPRDGDDYMALSHTAVHAVHDGLVASIRSGVDGPLSWMVVIDHLNGYFSVYRNLERPINLLERGERAFAGMPIGLLERGRQALRFELWRRDENDDYSCVSPIPFLRDWTVLQDNGLHCDERALPRKPPEIAEPPPLQPFVQTRWPLADPSPGLPIVIPIETRFGRRIEREDFTVTAGGFLYHVSAYSHEHVQALFSPWTEVEFDVRGLELERPLRKYVHVMPHKFVTLDRAGNVCPEGKPRTRRKAA